MKLEPGTSTFKLAENCLDFGVQFKCPGKEVSPAMSRNYSDNEKGAALAYVDFTQGNTRRASKVLGIPHTTLADWAASRAINPEVTEIRTHKKNRDC